MIAQIGLRSCNPSLHESPLFSFEFRVELMTSCTARRNRQMKAGKMTKQAFARIFRLYKWFQKEGKAEAIKLHHYNLKPQNNFHHMQNP